MVEDSHVTMVNGAEKRECACILQGLEIVGIRACWVGGSMIATAGCVVTCQYCYRHGSGLHPQDVRV